MFTISSQQWTPRFALVEKVSFTNNIFTTNNSKHVKTKESKKHNNKVIINKVHGGLYPLFIYLFLCSLFYACPLFLI